MWHGGGDGAGIRAGARRWPRRVLRAGLAATLATLLAPAPGRPMKKPTGEQRSEPNVPYDGRFTFVRIRYTVYGRSGWEFDYPAMERNLMAVTRELTTLDAHVA